MNALELANYLPTEVNPRFLTCLLENLRQRFPANPPRYDQLKEALRLATKTGATRYSFSAPSAPVGGTTAAPQGPGTNPGQNTSGTQPVASPPVASQAISRFAAILESLALRLFAWARALQSRASNPSRIPAPNPPATRASKSASSLPPTPLPPRSTSAHSTTGPAAGQHHQ